MNTINETTALEMLNHFPKAIVVLDNDIILYTNHKFLEMMAVTSGTTFINNVDKKFTRFIHPSYHTFITHWLSDLREGKKKVTSIELILFNVNNMPINIEIIGNELLLNDKNENKKVTVLCISNISERKRAEAEIQSLAFGDIVDESISNNYLSIQIEKMINDAKLNKHHLGFLSMEVNDFGLINDTYGRRISDLLLEKIKQRLEKAAYSTETIFPLKGNKYLIVMKEISDLMTISPRAEVFFEAISQAFLIESQEISVTITLGLSVYPENGTDVETLIKYADLAKFYAKQKGTNKVQVFTSSMASHIKEENNLLYALRNALSNNEFFLMYQPIVDTRIGKIIGLEALLRWRHEEKLLTPASFLSIAEETGLIFNITKWVIKTVCYQNLVWQKNNIQALPIAVNLSMQELHSKSRLVEDITDILKETKLAPHLLTLEMSEKITIPNTRSPIIDAFKKLGIGLTIDDFGVNNFSLHELKHYHINTIKIDRSLILKILEDKDEICIIEAIISMAQKLDINVIAEGIENAAQLELLNKMGCFCVQGHYFSQPLVVEELNPYLEGSKAFQNLAATV